jgi:DNA-binding LacI/PurR family transcriptional regulator
MATPPKVQRKTRKEGKRASSIEVARLAGVSQAAVSRVFTPDGSASSETRRKVLAAAKKLGYRPNAIARSLIQQSTNIIGLAVVRFTNPFYAQLIGEFTDKLQARGYWTLLLNVAAENEIERALPMALQYQVDGIIVTSATLTSKLADECVRAGTPVVLFNRYALESNVNAVGCDNVIGAKLIADVLLDAGHQRLAYIAGEEGSSTNRDRERGYTERILERGHTLHLRESGDYSYESGIVAARQMLNRADRPDAVFCANDLMAMAALDVARDELGIRVPEELSIVGFDDMAMASWPAYSLTTFRQPIDRLVDATIEVLLNAIENPDGERIIRWIPGTLMQRGSTRVVAS